MKAGLTTSIVLHAALLGFGLFALSAPAPLEVSDVEALPVDIVPLSELTQIQQGDKKAPMAEKAAPLPTERPDVVADAQKVGDNDIDTDNPPTPDGKPKPVKIAESVTPAPKPIAKPKPEETPKPKEEPKPVPATEVAPVPAPKEEVKPEPVKEPEPKPEPVKQPEPEPVKQPEPKPEPVKQPEPKPAEQPEEKVVAIEPAKPDAVGEMIAEKQPAPAEDAVKLPNSAPAPQARPAPAQSAKAPDRKSSEKPVEEASSKRQSDDTESLEDLVGSVLKDKEKVKGGGAKRSPSAAALGGEKATGGSKLSQSEMDALRGQVQRCWNIPAGAMDGEKLRVSVKFKLDRTGALEGSPEIISGGGSSGVERAAAEAARRAVARCSPYTLPAEKYETWADVVVNFDPSEMY
jgi:colicin import membrane protein